MCMFIVIIWTCACFRVTSGVCPDGRYGLDCSYTCHCTSGCDDVTGCSGNCKKGWSGPTCNMNNLALNKPAFQSSHYEGDTSPPSNGVDGHHTQVTSCILTDLFQNNSWWEVDLGKPHYIHNVTVHFTMGLRARRNDVHVYSSLEENQTNTGHLCGAATINSPDVTRITCDTTAQYITLYQGTNNDIYPPYYVGTAMDFCEVEVFICDAGTFGDDCTEFCHCQGQPCNYVTGECVGGCKQNWTGTQCNVCDYDHYGSLCSAGCSNRHCDQTNGISRCDKLTGRCDTGCESGWTGPDCTKKCPHGTFGKGCKKSCENRHCLENSLCDHVAGKCVGGCDRGYEPPDCTMTCDTGLYGADCSRICSGRHCLNKAASCNHVTGSCGGKCEESWRGKDCTGCDGKFGRDCSYSCSDRKCRDPPAPCHHVTGSCNGPCVAGWQGIACNVGVTESTDGGSTIVAMAAIIGILCIILIAVSGTFFWYVRRHRTTSGSITKEKTSVENKDGGHYENVGRQTGRKRDTARVDVSHESGYVNSQKSRGTDDVPLRPIGDSHESGNINEGQDIQLNEYEDIDSSESTQNAYDKITS
ncbi:multiple epidermal growth factor-like domains protein 11 isoform X3 [Gigantopelta aegis]|uniref:multiple epidermal growth factor-like domains protein 11 isoform X3 n=1 Tax=Gigantopelta aegis TaxID=1735272 RepID=UPI001B8878FE|nr:multiple epidermal growth factor-like domains protein 11 isoform X3 [Gigantopelta aegis]